MTKPMHRKSYVLHTSKLVDNSLRQNTNTDIITFHCIPLYNTNNETKQIISIKYKNT